MIDLVIEFPTKCFSPTGVSLRGSSDMFLALPNIEYKADSAEMFSIDLERGSMYQMLSASSSLALMSGKTYWRNWNNIHPNQRGRKQVVKAVDNTYHRKHLRGMSPKTRYFKRCKNTERHGSIDYKNPKLVLNLSYKKT